MGKRRQPKPYTKTDAIRTRCRLLDDNEFMSESEIKERKSKIAAIMYMEDANLKRQEADEKKRGYCPKCHCLRTTTGKCTSGCDEH